MSLFRKAAKRDQSERIVIETLRQLGWSVLQVSVKDGPDLFAAKNQQHDCRGYHSRTVAIEVKTGKKKLKPGQERFRESWAGEYVVLRSVDDVLALNGVE
jgi:Holliday junction resolvase